MYRVLFNRSYLHPQYIVVRQQMNCTKLLPPRMIAGPFPTRAMARRARLAASRRQQYQRQKAA